MGAHLTGQPLNGQLTERGARLVGEAATSSDYRLYALDGHSKPGLVRVPEGGASIRGEVWKLPRAALGSFLAALPSPMTLGPVQLADGRAVVGFGCEATATAGTRDITDYGGWLSYLADTASRPSCR